MGSDFPTFRGMFDALLDWTGLWRTRIDSAAQPRVRFREDAGQCVAALRLEREVEIMAAYVRRIVTDLYAIEVVYHGEPDPLGHFPYPFSVIAWVEPDSQQNLTYIWNRFGGWRLWRFPRFWRRQFGFGVFYRWPGFLEPVG